MKGFTVLCRPPGFTATSSGPNGINLYRGNYFAIEDVALNACYIAVYAKDTLGVEVSRAQITHNWYGIFADKSFGHTNPNNWEISNSAINSNGTVGVFVASPTSFNVRNNDVSMNGDATINPDCTVNTPESCGGLQVYGNPVDGAVGLVAVGNYFERNNFGFDISISPVGGSAPVDSAGNHTIMGNTFNVKTDAGTMTNFHPIRLDTTGATMNATMVNTIGNGFMSADPNPPARTCRFRVGPGGTFTASPYDLYRSPLTQGE